MQMKHTSFLILILVLALLCACSPAQVPSVPAEPLTEFRETDWLALVDYITVHSKKDIRMTFKDGTEIKA